VIRPRGSSPVGFAFSQLPDEIHDFGDMVRVEVADYHQVKVEPGRDRDRRVSGVALARGEQTGKRSVPQLRPITRAGEWDGALSPAASAGGVWRILAPERSVLYN
jgi:hypothetical protein